MLEKSFSRLILLVKIGSLEKQNNKACVQKHRTAFKLRQRRQRHFYQTEGRPRLRWCEFLMLFADILIFQMAFFFLSLWNTFLFPMQTKISVPPRASYLSRGLSLGMVSSLPTSTLPNASVAPALSSDCDFCSSHPVPYLISAGQHWLDLPARFNIPESRGVES